MALPLWGQLEKDTDDPETIEEAIARLISDHEEDPEAHLGEGESLEQHKSEDVIDHPAGSVLADKKTASEFVYDLGAGQGDLFTADGIVTTTGLRLAELETEEEGTQQSTISALAFPGFNPFSNDRNSMFEVFVYLDMVNDSELYAGVTLNSAPATTGYGFYWDNSTGEVKGFARFGATTYYTSALTVADETQGNFRAVYFADENVVYFFNNGTQVGSLTHASDSLTAGTYLVCDLIGNDDEGSVANIAYIYSAGSIEADI